MLFSNSLVMNPGFCYHRVDFSSAICQYSHFYYRDVGKGQCHEMVIEMRLWSSRLDVN
jgi:hypothetical protein